MSTSKVVLCCLGLLCYFSMAPTFAEIVVESCVLVPVSTIEIPAPEAGLLLRLEAREGASISANRSLGIIDAREEVLLTEISQRELDMATQEQRNDVRVRVAEKTHKLAEAELARAEMANRQLPNTVAGKEVERLRLAVDHSALEVEFAEFERELLGLKIKGLQADLKLAQFRADRHSLRSPINGLVSKLHKHTGEWVDAGEPVIRVVNLEQLRLEGYVPVEAALSGLMGNSVSVEVSLESGRTIRSQGKVTFVSPEAETLNSKVRFWAEVDNHDMRLRPGLVARAVVGSPPNAPSSSDVAETQVNVPH